MTALIKQSSLRYQEYILYYKSHIMVPLQRAEDKITKLVNNILESKNPKEVKKWVNWLSEICTRIVSGFRDFPVIFTNIEDPSNPDALLVKGAYQLKRDRLIIVFNSAFNPSTWSGTATGLLFKVLKVMNVLLDHELIHRAQKLVDGMKFSLWNFLKSKLSIKWYLQDPHELKAYGNTLAHDLAHRGIYHVEENIEALQRLRTESPLLNKFFLMAGNKRGLRKILVPIAKYANKWLAYYRNHLEELLPPQDLSSGHGKVQPKRKAAFIKKVSQDQRAKKVASLYLSVIPSSHPHNRIPKIKLWEAK